MRPQTLINLKRLRELRFAMQERLLTIIILAQPAMRSVLEDLPEVFMRSGVLELQGLSSEEVSKYLEFKLAPAGRKPKELFSEGALKRIRTGLHWPLRINHHMSRLLMEAVELGDVPVTEELVSKYVDHENNLTSLQILSGMSLTVIQRELAKLGHKPSRNTVKAVLQGREPKNPLVETIREVLVGRTGTMAALYATTAGGFTADERQLLEEIGAGMAALDYDFTRVARTCSMSSRRVFEITHGEDVTEGDLKRVHAAVGRLAKEAA